MKVFHGIDPKAKFKNSVLTIGTFDGVHIGHQQILRILELEAKKINGESILFTFHPHPKQIVTPNGYEIKMIQTLDERLNKLSKYNLDNVVLQPFTQEFSNITAEQFVKDYLVDKFNVRKIIIGHDHKFGKNREGGIEFLKEKSKKYDFEVIEIPAEEINQVNVSSTKVRNYLIDGDIKNASKYLNDFFEINGVVVEGKQLGRQIGFPTANIEVNDEDKLIPKNGVYFVKVFLKEGVFFGMLNIGIRPTIDEFLSRNIEVNIFNFKSEIYGQPIKIQFIDYLRDEKKFDSISDLIKQLEIDEINCNTIITNFK